MPQSMQNKFRLVISDTGQITKWIVTLVSLMILASCARFRDYSPLTYSKDEITKTFDARENSIQTLNDYVKEAGYEGEWPPLQWGIEELMYAGIFYSPKIGLAVANRDYASVEAKLVSLRPSNSVQIATEFHSREVTGEEPWGLGFSLSLPFISNQKKDVLSGKERLYIDASELDLTNEIWVLHGSIRDTLIELSLVDQRRKLQQQKVKVGNDLVKLIENRVRLGYASEIELNSRLLVYSEFQRTLETLNVDIAKLASELSTLVGLQSLVDTDLYLQFPDLSFEINDKGLERYRDLALHNRMDLQRALVEFGIADADFKLSLIKQYPEFSITPGYFWDQGDGIWAFASGLVLPADRGLVVSQAEGFRSLQRAKAEERQVSILSDVGKNYEVMVANKLLYKKHRMNFRHAQAIFGATESKFASGDLSRVELYDARLEFLKFAEQMIDHRKGLLDSLARLEDSCQTPFIYVYDAPIDLQLKTRN